MRAERNFSFRLGKAALACLFLVALFAAALRADSVTEQVPLDPSRKAALSVLFPVDEWDGFGFLPVMVHAENKSDSDYTWRFGFTHGLSRGRDRALSFQSEFTVTAPAHTSRSTVLWVPGGRAAADEVCVSLSLTVQGAGVQGLRWNSSIMSGWRGKGVCFAVSPQLERNYRVKHDEIKNTNKSAPCTTTMRASDWPADWRVWSPFTVVVMAEDEFTALDMARQAALREWVSLGGHLFLKPQGSVPARWSSTAKKIRHGLGAITMSELPAGMYVMEDSQRPLWRGQRVQPWKSLIKLLDLEDAELMRFSSVVWWLMIFLLLFGVTIGPVNLFLLAPEGKRHRLFFTVPAISIGASLLLMAVIVFSDGFGGQGVRRSLVVLMPGENKAVVAQQQVTRTGVLIGKKFSLADDTVMGKVGIDSDGDIPGKSAARGNGAASGDWFTSRAVESHVLMRVTPTRERVELVAGGKPGVAPIVQSSMSGVLRDFLYLDEFGRMWRADEVSPGRRVALSPHDKNASVFEVLHSFVKKDGRGYFHATMTGGELGLISSLDAIKWTDDRTTVIGFVEGGARNE
ncbi:hypothetical protein M2447_000526 [Ereboglobus sp. PH5-10]|uniref:hypothetical protein n=1 Tax=Ereboglobus sp. PH5-10 TaxID=2940629 RepID=UPI0024071CF5|nr:hypothetical protein [Ereboglobus sp. PH5-10]MDF9826445.1 hypothetical protein [Ereboglobus sp. PH5-10]